MRRRLDLTGLKIVVDCANGAAYKVAPTVLWELGAEVIPLAVAPDGFNINAKCGSTHPELLQEHVVMHGADIGIALDGDADRVILVCEQGQVIDGDQLMATIANRWAKDGRLVGGGLVATVMSNLGLERYLDERKLSLVRAPVGDRYVLERMRADGYNLGGEQSGHIIMIDHATTGDGLMAALQALSAMIKSRRPASEAFRAFEPVPQLSEERARRRRQRRPCRGCGDARDRRRRGAARQDGPHPGAQVRHRAPDPRHGRGRRSGAVRRVVDQIIEAMPRAGSA